MPAKTFTPEEIDALQISPAAKWRLRAEHGYTGWQQPMYASGVTNAETKWGQGGDPKSNTSVPGDEGAAGPKTVTSTGAAFGDGLDKTNTRAPGAENGAKLDGEKRDTGHKIVAKGADDKVYRFDSVDAFNAAHAKDPALFGSKADVGAKGKPLTADGGTAADRINAETGGKGTIASQAVAPPKPMPVAPPAAPVTLPMKAMQYQMPPDFVHKYSGGATAAPEPGFVDTAGDYANATGESLADHIARLRMMFGGGQ